MTARPDPWDGLRPNVRPLCWLHTGLQPEEVLIVHNASAHFYKGCGRKRYYSHFDSDGCCDPGATVLQLKRAICADACEHPPVSSQSLWLGSAPAGAELADHQLLAGLPVGPDGVELVVQMSRVKALVRVPEAQVEVPTSLCYNRRDSVAGWLEQAVPLLSQQGRIGIMRRWAQTIFRDEPLPDMEDGALIYVTFNHGSECLKVYCDFSKPYSELKRKLMVLTGRRPEQQRLIYAGRQLADHEMPSLERWVWAADTA